MTDVACRYKGKSLLHVIVKLLVAVAVYLIWNERNSRLFMGKFRDVTNVYLDIVLHVRLRINSLSGFPPSCVNRWLVSSWGIAKKRMPNPVRKQAIKKNVTQIIIIPVAQGAGERLGDTKRSQSVKSIQAT